MINKIRALQYKPISEFTNPTTRERLQFMISNRTVPNNLTYYAKIIDQEIQYELTDGSTLSHRISLTIFMLADETEETIIDCFTIPSYPFELRVSEDFTVLSELFEIYKSDIKEVMNYEKNSIA